MNRTQLYILIDDKNGFRVLLILKITNLVLKHKKTPNFHLEFLVTSTELQSLQSLKIIYILIIANISINTILTEFFNNVVLFN